MSGIEQEVASVIVQVGEEAAYDQVNRINYKTCWETQIVAFVDYSKIAFEIFLYSEINNDKICEEMTKTSF